MTEAWDDDGAFEHELQPLAVGNGRGHERNPDQRKCEDDLAIARRDLV